MTDLQSKVLFENSEIIIIDKDRLTAVHGGEGIEKSDTLLSKVIRYLTDRSGYPPGFIHPAHRIDLNTRGPVVFAKTRESAWKLSRAFSSGEVLKTYLALLEGKLETPLFVQADIIKAQHKKARVQNALILKDHFPSRPDWLAGKDKNSQTISATFIQPVNTHDDTTYCRIEIWTGRFHQIRAVCEAAGHPICGDTKYNHDPRDHYHRRINPKYPDGQMLLCKRIEIPSLGISAESRFDIIPAD